MTNNNTATDMDGHGHTTVIAQSHLCSLSDTDDCRIADMAATMAQSHGSINTEADLTAHPSTEQYSSATAIPLPTNDDSILARTASEEHQQNQQHSRAAMESQDDDCEPGMKRRKTMHNEQYVGSSSSSSLLHGNGLAVDPPTIRSNERNTTSTLRQQRLITTAAPSQSTGAAANVRLDDECIFTTSGMCSDIVVKKHGRADALTS